MCLWGKVGNGLIFLLLVLSAEASYRSVKVNAIHFSFQKVFNIIQEHLI